MSRAKSRLMPLTAALLLTAVSASAQVYPARPIRLLVPFPPGGLGDVVARMVAQKLGESFRQTIVVDNRGGAGGTIAVETAVRAQPDGYTLILVTASYTANAAIHKLGFDPVNDVTPVAFVGEGGNIATVLPSGPVASIKELIAYDKAHPGKLYYGSSGNGSSTHLAAGSTACCCCPRSRNASPPMAWNPPAARRSACETYCGAMWRSGRVW